MPSFCPSQPKILSGETATSILHFSHTIDLNLNIPAPSGTHTCARTFTNLKWSSEGLHVLLNMTIVMTVVYHKCLKILTYHPWKTEETRTNLTLLYKIRNNLLRIKENGYLETADSRTRDANRNYKF